MLIDEDGVPIRAQQDKASGSRGRVDNVIYERLLVWQLTPTRCVRGSGVPTQQKALRSGLAVSLIK